MKTLLATMTVFLSCLVSGAQAGYDANHPDLSDSSNETDYEQNPVFYAKGWHDGWVWASALTDKMGTYSDNCERICRKKYGNIDADPNAKTEFYGFLAAAAFVRNHEERASEKDTGTIAKRVENPWNQCPGGPVTEEAIKQLLDDPDSCNFDSATDPQLTKYNGKSCWLVVVQFRTKQADGAELTHVADVYMIGGDQTSIIDVRLRQP
jgi:hypothetical protein